MTDNTVSRQRAADVHSLVRADSHSLLSSVDRIKQEAHAKVPEH